MKIAPLTLINYISLLIVLLTGCKKENDVLPVSQYLKSMVPYKKDQLIKFASNDNEVITAKVEVEESIETCTTCQPNEKRQVFDYILRNTAEIDYRKVATLEIIDRAENYVFMTLYSPFHNFSSGIGFDFKTVSHTSQFFVDNERYFSHKTIKIGNKSYNDVLEINYTLYSNINENDLVILYYSKENGILKFEYKNGKSYQLVE